LQKKYESKEKLLALIIHSSQSRSYWCMIPTGAGAK
jgi:hypothetical protein